MSTAEPTPALPYATLLAFTRYVDRTGPAKASFVGGLRRQRERGGGFNPHSQLVKALKADIQFRTAGAHVAKVVDAVNPRYRRLYLALSVGAIQYLETLGDPGDVTLLSTHDTLTSIGGLAVKVAAHFGLQHADGRRECVRLHFDEEPPTSEAVTTILHLMSTHMDQLLPGAEPVLVDLRRGEAHRTAEVPRDPMAVERWLTGEGAGFRAMWQAA
jgi:hypothetical protein